MQVKRQLVAESELREFCNILDALVEIIVIPVYWGIVTSF